MSCGDDVFARVRQREADRHVKSPMMTWVPPDLMRRLTVEANRRDLSRSELVRRLLAEGLEHLRPADRAKLTRQTYR